MLVCVRHTVRMWQRNGLRCCSFFVNSYSYSYFGTLKILLKTQHFHRPKQSRETSYCVEMETIPYWTFKMLSLYLCLWLSCKFCYFKLFSWINFYLLSFKFCGDELLYFNTYDVTLTNFKPTKLFLRNIEEGEHSHAGWNSAQDLLILFWM